MVGAYVLFSVRCIRNSGGVLQFITPKNLENLAVYYSDATEPLSDVFGSSKWFSDKSSVFLVFELLGKHD